MKKEANLSREEDKFRSNNALQNVLLVPFGEESLLYCCRKLCNYNFSIYDSKLPKEAYCILWSKIIEKGKNEIVLL